MAIEKENIQVSIPSDFVPFVSLLKDGKTVDEKVKLSLAIGLFLWEFINILKAQEICWGEYGQEQERQDELTLTKLMMETENYND